MSAATAFATEFAGEPAPELGPEFGPEFGPQSTPGGRPGHPVRRLSAVPSVPAGAESARECRPARRPERPTAAVSVLHAPADVDSPPLRLTRRGVVVLTLAVALLGSALVWMAATSAPSSGAGPAAARGPAVVTVAAGDTLWTIAERVAPARDPRAEVDRLRTLNHLGSVDLVPGQQLRLR